MNGDRLAIRVREILRDVHTTTSQGEFWSDTEIRLALNQAQEAFINTCLRFNLNNLLSGLFSTTGYVTPIIDTTDPNYLGGWIQLPNDYLHYISGRVQDEEMAQYMARLYLGAAAEVYRNAGHAGIFIINNLYRGIFINNITVPVELNYYKRPYYIGLTSLGDNPVVTPATGRTDWDLRDFADYIYDDVIVGHATTILGMKETQTQREFKIRRNIFIHYNIFPKLLLSLLHDVESFKSFIQKFFNQQGQ